MKIIPYKRYPSLHICKTKLCYFFDTQRENFFSDLLQQFSGKIVIYKTTHFNCPNNQYTLEPSIIFEYRQLNMDKASENLSEYLCKVNDPKLLSSLSKVFDQQRCNEDFRKYVRYIPASKYMFKVNNRNTRTRCKIWAKLTIKTPERRHWR